MANIFQLLASIWYLKKNISSVGAHHKHSYSSIRARLSMGHSALLQRQQESPQTCSSALRQLVSHFQLHKSQIFSLLPSVSLLFLLTVPCSIAYYYYEVF